LGKAGGTVRGEEETYLSFTQSDHPPLIPSAQIKRVGVCGLENGAGLVRNSGKLIEKKYGGGQEETYQV